MHFYHRQLLSRTQATNTHVSIQRYLHDPLRLKSSERSSDLAQEKSVTRVASVIHSADSPGHCSEAGRAPEPPRKLLYFRSAEASNHNAKQPQSSDSSLEVWRRTLGIGCCKPGAERGRGRCICRLLIGWRPCARSSEKAHLL